MWENELEEYPLLLRVEDVMEITGLAQNTLYRLFANGTIPAIRLGRLWRVSKPALIQFMKKIM